MKFGISIFDTDYAIRIDEVAHAAEERGFESLWVPEHTHIPRAAGVPGRVGPNCPRSTGTRMILSSRSP